MKRERRTNGARLLAALLCVLMLMTLYTPCVWAADAPIDVNATTSLTVHYQVKDGQEIVHALSSLPVKLYQVATVSSDVKFTMTGEFSRYRVTVNNLTSDGWGDLAETLASYAERDSLRPLRTGETDAKGVISFADLDTGLYLVTAPPCEVDGVTYLPQSFLVCLPNRVDGEWQYDVVAVPKYSVLEKGDHMVQKVWKDGGQESRRPENITVQLLKNGEVYDTVTLNAANNWRYKWKDLDENALWRVVERDVPDGYTVLVDRQGAVFMMTNSGTPTTPGNPDRPNESGNPPGNPDNPGNPGNPNNPDNPGTPETPPEFEIPDEGVPQGTLDLPDVSDVFEEITGEPVPLAFALPQTGMLWWPVPILATAGMLCYLIGWMKNRRLGEHHGN